ncbi:M14 family metallopeptidase [Clostridium perfringens]|uniref:M14 family metallopeptidase n=1 Tax=Clostridium perfringens TaxID=1502 RepID=UPI002247F13F|nr:M14 family metallopeptidase [Clostridium perfringens]MCX0396979.1 M14 family metallopeptidase [Clostridium perfringens]
MPIEVIDKIKQKNGGTFKLMDAKDIAIDDTNIEDYAKNIKEENNKINDKINAIKSQTTQEFSKQINTINDTKADKKDLLVERKRIDLLTKIEAGETEGNTELLDIRVGADGNTYDTAGKSVREQFTNAEHRFLNLKNKYNINMNITFKKVSLLTTNGEETESNNRVASNLIEVKDNNINVYLDNYSCKYMLFTYSITTTGETKFKSHTEWTKEDLILRPGCAYRILLSYNDDREISDENGLFKFIKFNKYVTDSSIEKLNNYLLNIDSSMSGVENKIPLMLSECVKFKNLLNPNINFMFKNINTDTGVLGGNTTTRIVSDFVNIKKNSSIRIKPKENIKFIIVVYNKSGEFQSSEDWKSENYEKIYDDDLKVRLILAYKDDREIEANFDYKDFITLNIRDKVKGSFIESATLKPIKNFNFKLGSVNTKTGVEITSNTRISTEITLMQHCNIEIEPIEDSKFLIVLYDTNMNALSSTQWSSLKTNIVIKEPRYVKILFAYNDDRVLSDEEIKTFKKCIKSITNKNLLTSKVSRYYFRSEELPEFPIGENAIGYNDFIETYWENLRNNNQECIARNEIIKDTSNTFPIYEYIYTPKNYNKTVFLTAGVHGDEYEGFYGLYYFIKNIVENSYKHKQLRDIALNTRFVIIPVLNPWGVQNRTRRTSRVANANNNYDVMFNAREYEHDGTFGFSENESKAVKLIADKYEGELDLYFDFHTDFYDPQFGNYILLDCNSSNRKICENLIIDEIKHLKDKYNFTTEPKPNLVNINKRCSSFKYMDIVRKVPGAIIEVGTGRISPIGSSDSITRAVDWYTNVVCEHLKHDLKHNSYNKSLEKAVIEDRLKAYSNSCVHNISDDNLQLWLDYKDFSNSSWKNKANRNEIVLNNIITKDDGGVIFDNSSITLSPHRFKDYTLFFKGVITKDGTLITSENESFKLSTTVSSESSRFNIKQNDKLMYSSILNYNLEVSFCVRVKGDKTELFVNGEPFMEIDSNTVAQDNLIIGNNKFKNEAIGMKAKTIMLYDRALKDDEIGLVFKAI